MPLNQVRPNTPLNIPASSWNEIVRHVRGHTQNGGGGAGDIPPRSLDGTQQTLVKVQNNSGSALARYGILGISGFKVDPGSIGGESQQWLQQPIITGTTPAIDDHRSKFVVAIEPIANGEYGWACASGIVQVKVNIVDADHHGYAELKDADATQLESGLMGSARILQKQSGTGTKWALVRLGDQREVTYRARITGHATLDSGSATVGGGPSVTVAYKWKYSFTEVERSGDGFSDVSGGRTGTTGSGYAINLREANHTARYSWSRDIENSDYSANDRPMPIGAAGTGPATFAHAYDDIVEITETVDTLGNVVRHFSAFGSHDGECE